jgi:putative membrane protein
MRDFVLRVFINAIAIFITAQLLAPGIEIANDGNQFVTLLVIGLVISLINAFVKPVLKLLSCPFVLLTLGLFILVINGALLLLADYLLPTLTIHGFGWAILAGIIMAIVSTVLEILLVRGRR